MTNMKKWKKLILLLACLMFTQLSAEMLTTPVMVESATVTSGLKKENGKYQLDLWRANKVVLEEAGVRKEQIAVTNVCTSCNSEVLFSHRASNGRRGNLAAFLALKQEG